MATVLGRTFLISVGENDLPGQREGTVSLGQTGADVSTKADAGAPNQLPAKQEWSMSATGMVTSETDTAFVALHTAYENKTVVACVATSPGGKTYTGNAIATLETSGNDDEGYSYSVDLEAAGSLAIT